jgi:hypothetical protein
MPLPLSRTWLFSAKPSDVHASIEVAGAMVLRSTSSAEKSVCVSSFDLGPRSRDLGGCERIWVGGVVCRHCRRDANIVAVMGAIGRRGAVFRHCESMRVHWNVFRDIACAWRCGVECMDSLCKMMMRVMTLEHAGGPVFILSGSALEPQKPPSSSTPPRELPS